MADVIHNPLIAEAQQRADEKRLEGNKFFGEGDYPVAVELYTQAIGILRKAIEEANVRQNSENSTNVDTLSSQTNIHQLYTNRALCHIRMENYGLAVLDADAAIMAQPEYSKAYYRRGCAYICLMKFEDAEKDFVKVLTMQNDAMTRTKLKQCRVILREKRFQEAIKIETPPPLHMTIDVESISVDPSYKGPVYTGEIADKGRFYKDVLDYIKIPGNTLHRKYVIQIILDVINILKEYDSVVDLSLTEKDDITICGDIHGQFYDLLNIFEINGSPSETNGYLFNGDFVDRGSFSVECAIALFLAKAFYPKKFFITRGNHETEALNKCYGFKGEVISKYDDKVYTLFCESFCYLPLGYIINKKVLIVHGGLFGNDGVTVEQMKQVDRVREPPDEGIMTDMLWSDPKPSNGRTPSKRGVACQFGPDVTSNFLQQNGLELIIRSHEVKQEGYELEHNGQLITIFSAPNYCDQMGNKGAFIRMNGSDCKPKFTQFDAVEHPPVNAMQYADPLFNGIY
ncbi:Calcineurin-like phosphoesterase family protein [Babesia bovis T2Bo]|uniref:Calcineurin-like phosphoesterase family protein n=1 Tax=Babesia bovis T2Bo TaxID=484906 RepID=UPI001DCC1788|nr:Calcineurin-like phosphoesterase family protein [Babesia bovis T2Bo]EDO05616.2 Calcineurin-like phosphoesterase family protein [Babesia bovis T2Bo]